MSARDKRREKQGTPKRDERGAAAAAPDLRDATVASPTAHALGHASDSAWSLVFGCWLIAGASTLGALFFSEVMALPPCVLCWYQRIFMFPLAVVLPFGLFPFDGKIVRYALPLAVPGWLFSVFHLLLVAGFIPENISPCTQGVPCSDVQVQWLGFVSIPLLSFVAFSAVSAGLIAAHFRISK